MSDHSVTRSRISYVLVLTLFWLALSGSLTLLNLALGLGVSVLAVAVLKDQLPVLAVRARPLATIRLAWLVLIALFTSAWRVAELVLRPKLKISPDIVVVPVGLTRDAELTLLANLITLTPGTLTVDVSDDRRSLFVHALEAADPEAVRRDIRSGFERAIREAFR